jgi:hypothetical protein
MVEVPLWAARMRKSMLSSQKRHALRLSRINNKKAVKVSDLDQGHFLAFGDPFVNDLLVKSPDPADPNRWDFAFFGQLPYGYLMQS